MRQENLGRMGETLFENLCAEANLTANKANNDEHGWDYIVEFPREILVSSDLGLVDRQNIQCKVQVKATRQKKKTWQVELSNLHSMCTDSLPTFYFFVHYKTSRHPDSAYLLPVKEEIIFKTLKKYQENVASPNKKKPNKIKISLAYEKHLLKEISGNVLKESFMSHIGIDQARYITKKADILRTAGYEKEAARLNFSVKASAMQDFIDASIGLRDKVEVHSLSGEFTRFGIPQDIPQMRQNSALLSIKNENPITGKLLLKNDKFTPPLCVQAKLHIPPIPLIHSSGYNKLRIETDFFEIIISEKDNFFTMNTRLHPTKKFNIREANDFLSILKHAISKKRDIYFTFNSKELHQDLKFTGLPNSEHKTTINTLHTDLSHLTEVLNKLEIKHNVLLSLEEFTQSKTKTKQLLALLKAEDLNLEINYELSYEVEKNKESAVFFIADLSLGEYTFLLIFVAIGIPVEIDKNNYKLVTNKITCKKKGILDRGCTTQASEFIEALDNIIKSYSETYNTVKLIDKTHLQ